jgi:hypothetical protein
MEPFPEPERPVRMTSCREFRFDCRFTVETAA